MSKEKHQSYMAEFRELAVKKTNESDR